MNLHESLTELGCYITTSELVQTINKTKGTISLTLLGSCQQYEYYFNEFTLALHDDELCMILNSKLLGYSSDLGLTIYLDPGRKSIVVVLNDINLFLLAIESMSAGNEKLFGSLLGGMNTSMGKYLDSLLGLNDILSLGSEIEKDQDPYRYFASYSQLHDLFSRRNYLTTLCHSKSISFPSNYLLYVKKHYDLGLLKELGIVMSLVHTTHGEYHTHPESLTCYIDSLVQYKDSKSLLILKTLIKWSDLIIKRITTHFYSNETLHYLRQCFSLLHLGVDNEIRSDEYMQYRCDLYDFISNIDEINFLLGEKLG